MKASLIIKSLLVFGAVSILTIGCKATRRGIPSGGSAATFKVKLTGPFEEETTEKKQSWIYELSGCVPTVQASSVDDYDVATFKSASFKSKMEAPCQIKVKSLNIEAFDKSFKSPEAGTFYWSRKVPLQVNSYGEFYTVANLEKIYSAIEKIEEKKDPKVEADDPKETLDTGDVTINSTTEDCTDGKVFDTVTKTCKTL
jgi:hypothetical protein